MKARKPTGPTDGDFEINNAENYAKRAIAFGQRRGYDAGSWPVVRSGSFEFDAWLAYFEKLSHDHAKAGSFARQRGVLTVPSVSPDEFEPGWQARPREPARQEQRPDYRRELDMMSPEDREASRGRVAAMMASVKRLIAGAVLHGKSRHSADHYRDAAE
jgi:hypothetical protein